MADTPSNNELLSKILDRLDQLDEKFTGEIQAVGKRVDQLDEKFTGEVQAVGKRVDQLDEKFTGEIRQLDQKFTGEIRQLDQKFTGEIQSVRVEVQATRKESQNFHDAAKATWEHIRRIVENSEHLRAAFEQKMDQRWDEQQKNWLARHTG